MIIIESVNIENDAKTELSISLRDLILFIDLNGLSTLKTLNELIFYDLTKRPIRPLFTIIKSSTFQLSCKYEFCFIINLVLIILEYHNLKINTLLQLF